MTTTTTIPPKPPAKAAKSRATPKPFGLKLQRGSPHAERTASAILEVLAGARLPSEAAVALGCSSARYYALESRALSGLIAACEPRPPGKQRRPEGELNTLRKECDRLRRESARWQALVRLARRTTGLSPPPTKPDKSGKRRKRRATVRALRAVALLKEAPTLGSAPGGDDHDARTAPGGPQAGGAAGRIAPSQAAAAGDSPDHHR